MVKRKENLGNIYKGVIYNDQNFWSGLPVVSTKFEGLENYPKLRFIAINVFED